MRNPLKNPRINLIAGAVLAAGALMIPVDGVVPRSFSWLLLGLCLGTLLGSWAASKDRGGR